MSVFDALGLGFSGYVEIDGKPLPLDPSQNAALDNLIKSQSNVSSVMSQAEGDIPVRDRRSLTLGITVPMCAAALRCYDRVMFEWRRNGDYKAAFSVKAIIASGEGFESSEAYFTGGSLNVPQEGLCSVTFEVTAWRWENLTGTNGPDRVDRKVPVLNNADYQPIPFWAASMTHSGQPGICQSIDFAGDQRYFFGQLLEVTARPPTPRVVTGGPLSLNLTYVTIAEAGGRPAESGSATMKIGGVVIAGNGIPEFTFSVPFMYRDPQYSFTGWGSAEELIRLSVGWALLGETPTLSG